MYLIDSKEKIQEEANDYENLAIKNTTKNGYVFFIIFILIINYFTHGFLGEFALSKSEVLVSSIVYFILAIFIYFHHRWAMAIWAFMFIVDKMYMIFFIASLSISSGAFLMQIFFGYIAFALAFNSIRVATSLKRIKKLNETPKNS
jgi:hypothetical protein